MVLAGDIGALSGPPARDCDYRQRSRRSWTIDEKLAIVAEAEASDETVAAVARRHGMNANHLFNWIQRAGDGTLDRRGLGGVSDDPTRFIDLGVTDPSAGATPTGDFRAK